MDDVKTILAVILLAPFLIVGGVGALALVLVLWSFFSLVALKGFAQITRMKKLDKWVDKQLSDIASHD